MSGPSPAIGAAALVPPRPNLGPEPWESSRRAWIPIVAGGVVCAAIIALAARRLFSRKPAPADESAAKDAAELPVRDVMRLLSRRIRDTLIARFGADWAGLTTEEIAADRRLPERLPPEDAAKLISMLTIADNCKFANAEYIMERSELDGWREWVGRFAGAAIAEKPAARDGAPPANGRNGHLRESPPRRAGATPRKSGK